MILNGLGRASSLPQLQGQDRAGKNHVPSALKSLGYHEVVQQFHTFDIGKKGHIDTADFQKMMKAIQSHGEPIDKAFCDQLFCSVDTDGSGTLDLEEFLGWIFGSHTNYCAGVRKRLSAMNMKQLVEHFRVVDERNSNELTKPEFFQLISRFSPEAKMSQKETDKLFTFIDTNKSGGVDVTEFVTWVWPNLANHPENRGHDLAMRNGRRQSSKIESLLPVVGSAEPKVPRSGSMTQLRSEPARRNSSHHGDGRSESKAALFEMRPGDTTTLDFTIGQGFTEIMKHLKKIIHKLYGDNVHINVIKEANADLTGCTRVYAKVGRGILLWDRYTMMTTMDDPFQTYQTAQRWVVEVLTQHMPASCRVQQTPAVRSPARRASIH